MKKKLWPFCCLFFSMIVSSVSAAGFYDGSREGFFWYEAYEAIEKKEKAIKNETDDIYPPIKPDSYHYKELWNLHPDLLKNTLEKRFKLAVQFPDENNILRYMEIQDVAKRKSDAFSNAMSFVSQKHPRYEGENTSITMATKKIALEKKEKEIEKILNDAKEHFALIVLVKSGCSYCDLQKAVMEEFRFMYGWTVKELPLSDYPDIVEKHKVTIAPTTILIHKKDMTSMSIAKGYAEFVEMEKRVAKAVRYMKGDVKPEQYDVINQSDPLKFIND